MLVNSIEILLNNLHASHDCPLMLGLHTSSALEAQCENFVSVIFNERLEGLFKSKASKTNFINLFLLKSTALEPIIQSEVSQKEKHQYSILTHIYGI